MKLSQWKLEKILHGELRAEDVVSQTELPGVEKTLSDMRKTEALLFKETSPHLFSTQLLKQLKLKTAYLRFTKSHRRPLLAFAGSLVLLIFFLPFVLQDSPFTLEDEVTRIKGPETKIWIYRETDLGSELLNHNDSLNNGQRLQIQYFSVAGCYGFIYSKDGSGQITRHLPIQADSAAPLDKGEHYLKQSYTLDDAPTFEHFVFITSQKPFKLSEVLNSSDSLGMPTELDSSLFDVQSLHFFKKTGPP